MFKANGHELLLDGTFASFTEKRSLANMSPTSFSTTLASISNVNVANIPAASAPSATFAKDLNKPTATTTTTSLSSPSQKPSSPASVSATASPSGPGGRPKEPSRTGSAALLAGSSGQLQSSPTNKLVPKKKLVKSSKRVKRIVNLDSDHDGEDGHHSNCEHEPHEGVLAPPVEIGKKKKKKKSIKEAGEEDEGKVKTKKKGTKKKSAQENNGGVSFADHHEGQAHDEGEHHVHRVAQLEQSMANLTHCAIGSSSTTTSPRPKSILKRPSVVFTNGEHHDHDNGYSPASPMGSISSTDTVEGFGGADGYRRKIEAMRNEAGSNWLKVLAEMEGDGSKSRD